MCDVRQNIFGEYNADEPPQGGAALIEFHYPPCLEKHRANLHQSRRSDLIIFSIVEDVNYFFYVLFVKPVPVVSDNGLPFVRNKV